MMGVVEDFRAAEFGNARLGARLLKIVEGLAREPAQSFPEAAGSDGALEATYRFLANDSVTPEAILRPHVSATVKHAWICSLSSAPQYAVHVGIFRRHDLPS
jgi:hypothetical protein